MPSFEPGGTKTMAECQLAQTLAGMSLRMRPLLTSLQTVSL